MPSELMDSHGLSPSSFLTEEVQHPNERQIGFRKADGMPDNFGLKDGKVYAVGDSSESHIPNLYRSQDHHNKVHISSLLENNNTVGAVGHSFRNNDKGNRSNLNMEHNKYYHTAMGDHYENGLFSSSLSDLFTRKLRVSANNSSSMYGHGHSVGAAGGYEEEPFESLEEIEAQTIGNLLPDDEDLLSGVTDGLDCKVQQGDDVEELDFFSSVGGMELGEDGGGQKNNYAEQQPNGESPSRTLFVRNINSNVEDSELRILFEQYGEIRTLYTACKHRGFVMISYYDIRAARCAMQALQNKPLRRRKLDIHYSIPKDNPSDKDTNQGTVVIFNGLDFNVSNEELGRIFGVYGEVKEIHEGSRHKSIEFYDIRAAEAAVRELNKSEIGGKQMKLEPSSRPPTKRFSSPFPELDPDETSALLQMCSTTADGSMDSGTALLGVPPTAAQQLFDAELQHGIIPSTGFSSIIGGGGVESGMNQLKYDFRTPLPNYHHHRHPHPHSLPDNNNILCNSPSTMAARISGNRQQQFNRIGGRSLELNDTVFGSSGNASSHPYNMMWNPSHQQQQQQQQATHNMMWPNSPSFMNGAHSAPLVHAVPRAPSHVAPAPNTFLHINNHHHHHHVGSAPSVNPSSIWDRRHSYAAGESPDFHPGSLGNMRVSPLDFVSPHNMFPPHMGDMPIPSKTIHHHSSTVMFPSRGGGQMMMGSFDSSSDRARIRSRNEGTSNQPDSKKQFDLDLDRIMRAEDRRTTLMIKNIPNKYTSKMLLAAIDERHRGTYDFIYLPIDFKNKCNVGYAFINMTDPSLIIPFYQAFNGKKWEKFNSEKVASLAYARIQGKAALIAHFQNSSLMNEDKRCRPILFHTDGPNAGDQVPFPMGVNVRSRVNKNRNSSTNDESSQDVGNGEASSNGGDSSSGSTKDFELC